MSHYCQLSAVQLHSKWASGSLCFPSKIVNERCIFYVNMQISHGGDPTKMKKGKNEKGSNTGQRNSSTDCKLGVQK